MVKSGRHHLVVVSNGPFWPLLLNTHFSLFSADISSVRVPLNWCYSLGPNPPSKSQVTTNSVTITQVTMLCLCLITILSTLLLGFSGHMCTFTVVTIVTATSTYLLVPGVSSQLLHIWLRLLSLHFFKRLSHQPPLSTFQQVDRISLAKTSMQLIGQPLSTLSCKQTSWPRFYNLVQSRACSVLAAAATFACHFPRPCLTGTLVDPVKCPLPSLLFPRYSSNSFRYHTNSASLQV